MDTEVCYEPTVPLFSVTEGWTGFVDALEDCCEKGIVFKGDTAEELAWAMGVDEKMLADTISDYNACCEAGVDALLGKNTRDSQPWYRISRHGCHGRHNFHKYLLPKADIRCFATTGPRDLPLYQRGYDVMGKTSLCFIPKIILDFQTFRLENACLTVYNSK